MLIIRFSTIALNKGLCYTNQVLVLQVAWIVAVSCSQVKLTPGNRWRYEIRRCRKTSWLSALFIFVATNAKSSSSRSLSCLCVCVSCRHFFIRDRTILGHLSSILHTVDSESINATSAADSNDADRLIRWSPQNFPFFTVIQLARSSTTLLCTIFFLVTQEVHNSLPGALDDICNPLHRVTDHDFKGDQIVLFYEYDFGYFPYFNNSDPKQPVNGGLPQKCPIWKHLLRVSEQIRVAIPREDFAGIAVIDIEEWRPLYHLNWGRKKVYKSESIQLIREQYPNISYKSADELARKEFNAYARKIFLSTIGLAKRLRPYAKWGFYGFPYCNYGAGSQGDSMCNEQFRAYNDELSFVTNSGNAIFPSIYLANNDSHIEHFRYIQAIMMECQRVAAFANPPLPIFPYDKFEYKPYEFLDSFYTKFEMWMFGEDIMDGIAKAIPTASSVTQIIDNFILNEDEDVSKITADLGSLLLLIFVVPSTTDAPSSLGSFAKSLISHFEYQSRAKLVEEAFEKVKKHIRVHSEYPQTALLSSKKQLERLFSIRVKALQLGYLNKENIYIQISHPASSRSGAL
uniref:Hyaluronidase n=1 Tax=Heterorhabditis bacteriophora TaxID=37862 RepID=A0A1I7XEJ4_HETBA